MKFMNGDAQLLFLSPIFIKKWKDLIRALVNFKLHKTEMLTSGGGKSPRATKIDKALSDLGWREKSFDPRLIVDK